MKKVLPLVIALILIAAVAVVLALTVLKPKAPAEPSPSETPDTTPVETGSPEPTGEPGTPSPDGDGMTEYVMEVGGTRYSVTVRSDDFDVTETASGRRFTLKTVNNVFFETSYIPDKTALSAAPAFLDAYIDYLELESSGKNYIPGTDIIGEMVVGYRNEDICTAWLVDINGGVVAVTVSYSGEIPQAVYDALETFTIEK
jgi:hypothetical protein